MIPVTSLDQFKRVDGWLAVASSTHGYKLAASPNKVRAPHEGDAAWGWNPVHRSEVSRMRQVYKSPDLTDPIRCSYLTFEAHMSDAFGFESQPCVIDVEPCRVFHDEDQQLHTLWIPQQDALASALESGALAKALGITGDYGYNPKVEQLYFDGRYLYRFPWAAESELTDEILTEAGAQPVNAERSVWRMLTAAIPMQAGTGWNPEHVPKDNTSLFIYRSPTDATVWGHTPPTPNMSLTTATDLVLGSNGLARLDKELTLNLDFALDAARVVGRWCGPAAADALELPKAMLALKTVNLSNLLPSERALTPIGMTFSQALIWLMGRSRVCRTPTQCLDFKSLFSDLYMRRSCMSEKRLDVRKLQTLGQPIPQLSLDMADSAAAMFVARREKARLKRREGLQFRRREQARAAEEAHAAVMKGRRTRRRAGGSTRRSDAVAANRRQFVA